MVKLGKLESCTKAQLAEYQAALAHEFEMFPRVAKNTKGYEVLVPWFEAKLNWHLEDTTIVVSGKIDGKRKSTKFMPDPYLTSIESALYLCKQLEPQQAVTITVEKSYTVTLGKGKASHPSAPVAIVIALLKHKGYIK